MAAWQVVRLRFRRRVTLRFRWLVVETGNWLSERQVLVHPSAIGKSITKIASCRFTLLGKRSRKAQASPPTNPCRVKTKSFSTTIMGWTHFWAWLYDMDMLGGYIGPPRYFGAKDLDRAMDMAECSEEQDPDLRSLAALTGTHVHATDGSIGHVENVLIDDANWDARYLIVDTSNWWMGKHVLISPYAIEDISWANHRISLNVTTATVKSSTPWDPIKMVSEMEERGLHSHYAWPGYGWR